MITIVAGGQYGGEGKGKIASFCALRERFDVVCRCGGVNSSHTVAHEGGSYSLRMMPASSVIDKRPNVVFGAGTLIHEQTLLNEIKLVGYDPSRILVDWRAGVVTSDCVDQQRSDVRYSKIGSTLTGTGYASARRAMRSLGLAADSKLLRRYLVDTVDVLFKSAKAGRGILIEGHQGAGLSNYHGDYPYCSSRDSTAAEFLSELGIGLRWNFKIILVCKVFPTRNHAGALYGELTEEEANTLKIEEYGGGAWGVGNRRRRVGTLDFGELRRSVQLNTPTEIALTGLDYYDPRMRDIKNCDELSGECLRLVEKVHRETGIIVSLLSTGPDTSSIIQLRGHSGARVGI